VEESEEIMNKVELIGRTTRDPEVRYSSGENSSANASFTLAVNRRVRQGEEQQADFIRCVAFGKQAEFIEKYIKKGVKLAVIGRIQTGSYTNKEGQRVYTTDVIVEELEFAESKNSGSEGSEGSSAKSSPSQGATIGDGFMNIPDGIDEELPFV
jgi:single-strand DNA-binding protein